MRIAELDGAGPIVDRLYHEILQPSFPDDEMIPLQGFQHMARTAHARGLNWIAIDTDDTIILGCAIGEWNADPGIMLLSWLAVRPGHRGRGIGGPLLDHTLTQWKARYDPCLILAEIEDPAQHSAEAEIHGDPAARLRFYQRRGGRALDLPYFQPSLGPDKSRVRGLLLMVLHAAPSFAGAEPDTIDGTILRKYFELYQTQYEGAVGTDDEAQRLLKATDRPGGVPLLPNEAQARRAPRRR